MQLYIDKISNSVTNLLNTVDQTVDLIEKNVFEYFSNLSHYFTEKNTSLKIVIFVCDNNKFYLEETKSIHRTINHYLKKNEPEKWNEWVIINQPQSIYTIIDNVDSFDLDKYVFYMMFLFGIENVRGGSFVDNKLTDNDIVFLNKMMDRYHSKYDKKKKEIISNNIENTQINENIDVMTDINVNINDNNNINNKTNVSLNDSIISDYY
ncbi:hypothetical protein Catovirus_2_248 [Catovirus CTV1]|uniref:Uncharacterized protein n=1 Tax=Catovirus CTV1 TaxID=1977631 RepID=A0A1V0SC70_9VIRU|nr:hypothetical protein Catovirus_2_248 [Catovirus CTV1]